MPAKPGDIITPASFAVAPELLGRPLARPSRRALAMLLDLAILGIVVNIGGSILFGITAALILFRASGRPSDNAFLRRWMRGSVRVGAAVVLFIVIVVNWGFWHRIPGLRSEHHTASVASHGLDLGLGKLGALGEVIALKNAPDAEHARTAADKLVRRMAEQGMSPEDLRDMERDLASNRGSANDFNPYALPAFRAALAAHMPSAARDSATSPDARRDSLARAYVAALEGGSTADARRTRAELAPLMAQDTLDALQKRITRLSAANSGLQAQVARDTSEHGVVGGFIATVADAGGEVARLLKKAGLGFGWTGLYFTAFVALMRGQTPGKRLLKLRIVRLDGERMGWWASFERFGGYAASIVTGLGGFFQILWDRNRQGVHDKIAETVVVQE